MKNLFYNYRVLFIIGILTSLIAITLLFLVWLIGISTAPSASNSSSTYSSGITSTNFSSIFSNSSSPANKSTYSFIRDYAASEFVITYPNNFNLTTQDGAGAWDVVLKNDNSVLELELSADLGPDGKNVENMINSLATKFATEPLDYSYELLSKGETSNGRNFSIYEITSAQKPRFLVAFVYATELTYGSPGYLGMRTNTKELLGVVREVIESLK